MAFKMRGFSGFKQKKDIITTGQQKRRAQAERENKNIDSLLDRQNLLSTQPQKTNDIRAGGPRRDPSDNTDYDSLKARDRVQGQKIRGRGVDVQVNAAMQGRNKIKDLSRSEKEAVALSKRLEKPFKQYADKNVSVDKVSDDGMTFTGTDSKGKTGQYKTSGYDAEIMQSDSVGVSGDAVSNMQMEYDMVKGTKYEKDFIDYHGKGNKPGTGKSPAKQTSHGPIREFNPPRNPNEGPYIVRSKPTGQTREPNNDGPDYRHIRERTGLDDGPHAERPQSIGPSPHQSEILKGRPAQLRNYDAFKAGAGSPAKKYVSDAQRKAVHASKAERGESPAKQVAHMKKATKRGEVIRKEQLPTMVKKQKKALKKDNKKITKRI